MGSGFDMLLSTGSCPGGFLVQLFPVREGTHLGLVSEQFSGSKVYNREAGWSSWYNGSQGGAGARNVIELNNYPRTFISWDNSH